ncbi:MAG: transcriptional repressor [Gammaproteobacteria bacterium]|nr:transcriptional repressor [Gammaproteobacteria bacterium]
MQERNTKQKQTIARLIRETGHPLTVQEILDLGRGHMSRLGIATVYRTLRRLLDAGELQTVVIPGDVVRYEAAMPHHHHFKCRRCDRVYDLDGCVKALKSMVPKGFKVENHELTLYGCCRSCA